MSAHRAAAWGDVGAGSCSTLSFVRGVCSRAAATLPLDQCLPDPTGELRRREGGGVGSQPVAPRRQWSNPAAIGSAVALVFQFRCRRSSRRSLNAELRRNSPSDELMSLAARAAEQTDAPEQISRSEWRARAAAYKRDVEVLFGGLSGSHIKRHPVLNFFRVYYAFDPSKDGAVRRWSPGLGVRLLDVFSGDLGKELPSGNDAPHLLPDDVAEFRVRGHHLASAFKVKELARIRDVLAALLQRPPLFGCYGLHEWAMLYRPSAKGKSRRHQRLPLRVSQEEIDSVVDKAAPLKCTHFDAVRFYTPHAMPLNEHKDTFSELGAEAAHVLEQPGCVHVAMDLFRWTRELWPFVPSELLRDALSCGLRARILDMRASPYDLSEVPALPGHPAGLSEGEFSPVRVETRAGQVEYAALQEKLWHSTRDITKRLLSHYDAFLAAASAVGEDAGSVGHDPDIGLHRSGAFQKSLCSDCCKRRAHMSLVLFR